MNHKIVHKLLFALLALLILVWITRQVGFWDNVGGKTEPEVAKPSVVSEEVTPAYNEVRVQAIPLDQPRCMAVVERGILLAGVHQIVLLDEAGNPLFMEKVSGTVSCIAVDSEEDFYACVDGRIVHFNPDGKKLESFPVPGEERMILSIAVTDDSIFLSDASAKEVLRMSKDGTMLNRIGGRRASEDFPGFIVPSPYFDLGLDNFGNLWVANPGRHELHHFDPNGTLISTWGKASYSLEGFCGCCNPTAFTILSNGAFLTVEKGIVRVKIHQPDGRFMDLVAGPSAFDEGTVGLEVGENPSGEIVIMDPKRKTLRYFERRE